MRRILHIKTDADEYWPSEIVSLQRQEPDQQVQVFELTAPNPDYRLLLEEIFASDSVQVW
jgi:hypothetical protein